MLSGKNILLNSHEGNARNLDGQHRRKGLNPPYPSFRKLKSEHNDLGCHSGL
jgi:hypothetical protein